MDRRITLITLIGAALALALPAASFGQVGPYWNCVASACVVDEGDVNDYLATYEEVYFKTGVTGYIVMRCNVNNPDDGGQNPGWDRFGLTFKDPDGTATANSVKAYLRRVSRTTGSTSTVATFDSNRFAGTGTQFGAVDVNHSWNFWDYYYFVEFQLYRSGTGDVRAYGGKLYLYFGAAGGENPEK
ncbi:MAG: hypothetical protein AB1714_10755 [Acidobacteriota bacterium]